MITELDVIEILNDSVEFAKDMICDTLKVNIQDFIVRGCFEYYCDQLVMTLSNTINDVFHSYNFQCNTEIFEKVCYNMENKYSAFLITMKQERVFKPCVFVSETLQKPHRYYGLYTRTRENCNIIFNEFLRRLSEITH